MPRSDAPHRFAIAAAERAPSSMAVNTSRSMPLLSAAERWYPYSVSKTTSADGIVGDKGRLLVLPIDSMRRLRSTILVLGCLGFHAEQELNGFAPPIQVDLLFPIVVPGIAHDLQLLARY